MKVNIPANTIEVVHVYSKHIAPVCGEAAAQEFENRAVGHNNSDVRQLAQFYLTGLMTEVDAG